MEELEVGTAPLQYEAANDTWLAMTAITHHRTRWLTRHVLPHEVSLRKWLAGKQLRGIDLDDIVQDTYAILAGLESVDAIYNAKAYMFQTAYSLILRQIRRAQIISISTIDDISQLAGEDKAPSPETEVSDRQQLQLLTEAIHNLPARGREVFVLRKIHGLNQREVARKLGISESAVEKQMQKSLRILMAVMGRGGIVHRRSSKIQSQHRLSGSTER